MEDKEKETDFRPCLGREAPLVLSKSGVRVICGTASESLLGTGESREVAPRPKGEAGDLGRPEGEGEALGEVR